MSQHTITVGSRPFGWRADRLRWQCIAMGALCAASSWASPSRADGAAPGPGVATGASDADVSLADQAWNAFAGKQYEQARSLYARAYELDPKAQTLLGLALAEFYGQHHVEAAAHFRQYLNRPDALPDKVALVRAWLQGAEAHVAHLEIHVPPGARVSVDGSAVSDGPGEAPISIDVRAGSHEVAARHGATSQVRYIVAQGGQRLDIEFAESAPSTPREPAGRPSSPPRDDSPNHRAKWATAIAFGTAAVVAAGVATTFAIVFETEGAAATRLAQPLSLSACTHPSTAPPECAPLQADLDAQRTSGALATGFYVGAGAAAAVAVGALLFWPSRSSSGSAAVRAVPVVGDRQAGFVVSRAW